MNDEVYREEIINTTEKAEPPISTPHHIHRSDVQEFGGRKFDRAFMQRHRRAQAMYPATNVLTPAAEFTPEQEKVLKREWKHWSRPPILDQGSEGACTGYSAATFVNAGKVRPSTKNLLTGEAARELYHMARTYDEWPGESYEGSSVNGAALALRERGFISTFHWAREMVTVIRALLLDGPVMFGLDWTEGMMYPDAEGFIRPTGPVVGGHAITGVGVNVKKEFRLGASSQLHRGYVLLAQSWGAGHGDGGFVKVTIEDLAVLLDGIEFPGDACVAVEHRVI